MFCTKEMIIRNLAIQKPRFTNRCPEIGLGWVGAIANWRPKRFNCYVKTIAFNKTMSGK
jgi:hypothetical protein